MRAISAGTSRGAFDGRIAAPVLLVCALAALTAPLAIGQESAELELRLRDAERKLQQGDTVGALLDVESVLGRDDTLWRAYAVRGRIQAAMGDDLGARASFMRAVELDPGNADLHFVVASVALQLADFDVARRQLLAAAQAGYDPGAVRSLGERMKEYLKTPLDLDAAFRAPRIAVLRETEPAAEDAPLAMLDRELRTLLLESSDLALVQRRELARWWVRLERGPGLDDGSPGSIRVLLIAAADESQRLERTLTGDGAQARVELGDLVEELAAEVGR